MNTCIIDLKSQTASFRDPDFQNFHRTLSLPSPTNIIGLVGAALGLAPTDAQVFFKDNEIKIGVFGDFTGRGRDLWKYCKATRNTWQYHPSFISDSSIVTREFLYDYHLKLAFASPKFDAITKIVQGFRNPFFCLTLGNSDSLAKVVAIYDQGLEVGTSDLVSNCYLEGDVMMQIKERVKVAFDFSLSAAPSVHNLPTSFNYKTAYGFRKIASTKMLSIILGKAQLNFKVNGIKKDEIFIPLITL